MQGKSVHFTSYLDLDNMEIRVKSLRSTFLIAVPYAATVEQVRARLPQAICEGKQLVHAGKALSDSELVSNIAVNAKCELLLLSAYTESKHVLVRVTQAYNHISMYCSVNTSVQELKPLCVKKLALDHSVIQLLHDKKVLSDATVLRELGAAATSLDITVEIAESVQSTHGNMRLTIKFVAGTEMQVAVHPNISIRELKQVIGEQAQISTLGIRLIFAGRELWDETLLYRSGAGGGCTFHALYRLPGG